MPASTPALPLEAGSPVCPWPARLNPLFWPQLLLSSFLGSPYCASLLAGSDQPNPNPAEQNPELSPTVETGHSRDPRLQPLYLSSPSLRSFHFQALPCP